MIPVGLVGFLRQEGVSPQVYYVEGAHDDFLDNNCLSLQWRKGRWLLEFNERGTATCIGSYENFDEAAMAMCEHLVINGSLSPSQRDRFDTLVKEERDIADS